MCQTAPVSACRGWRAAAAEKRRSPPTAIRWAGRLALEVADLELAELEIALESLHALPDEHAQHTLLMLAERARKAAAHGSSGAAASS